MPLLSSLGWGLCRRIPFGSHKLHATKEVLDQVMAGAQTDPKLQSVIRRDYLRILAFKKNHRGHEAPAAMTSGN